MEEREFGARADAAWWKALPTAWIHLLFIECFHIYVVVLSWHSLVVKINAKCAMIEHHVSTAEITSYYGSLFFFGFAREVALDFNGGHELVLPEAYIWTEGVNIPWFLVAWTVPCAAAVLLVFIVWRSLERGLWSFESARYLDFTWHLSKTRAYRLCVGAMAVGPVVLPLLWFVQVMIWTWGEQRSQQLGVMISCTPNGLLLLLSLDMLAFPTYPVHYWGGNPDFLRLHFRRSWLSLLLQRNSSFGCKLMDALWTAEHGDLSRLKRFVPDPHEIEYVLDVCRRAQDEEVRNKKAIEMGKMTSASESIVTDAVSASGSDNDGDVIVHR